MFDLNLALFQVINEAAGRSWLLDSIIALALANELIKSAPIAACFVAAWFNPTQPDHAVAVRRALILTLLAVVGTLGTTQVISRFYVQPRPYLRTHKVYQLMSGQLSELPHVSFRQPLDNRSREREKAVQVGNVPPEDLRAFPSDHAALFVCVSAGIYMATRRIGVLAIAWTLMVVVFGKLVTGMHAPIEILAGASIALVWLGAVFYVSETFFGGMLERIGRWTTQYPCVASGAVFMVLFEVASMFDHAKAIASAIGKHI